jgi:hypothetical protein
MRVAVLYPAPAPYREKLFLEFSRLRDIDLCVYYCASSLSNRDGRFISEIYKSSCKICVIILSMRSVAFVKRGVLGFNLRKRGAKNRFWTTALNDAA